MCVKPGCRGLALILLAHISCLQSNFLKERTHLLFDISGREANTRMVRFTQSIGAWRSQTFSDEARSEGFIGVEGDDPSIYWASKQGDGYSSKQEGTTAGSRSWWHMHCCLCLCWPRGLVLAPFWLVAHGAPATNQKRRRDACLGRRSRSLGLRARSGAACARRRGAAHVCACRAAGWQACMPSTPRATRRSPPRTPPCSSTTASRSRRSPPHHHTHPPPLTTLRPARRPCGASRAPRFRLVPVATPDRRGASTSQDFGRGGRNCSYFSIAPIDVAQQRLIEQLDELQQQFAEEARTAEAANGLAPVKPWARGAS